MNWQQSQLNHVGLSPVLPSFTKLVTALAQPGDRGTQESRVNISNVDAGPVMPKALYLPEPVPTGLKIEQVLFSRKPLSYMPRESSLHEPGQSSLLPHNGPYSIIHLVGLKETNPPTVQDSLRPITKRGADVDASSSMSRSAKRQRKDRNQQMDPYFTRDGNPRKRLAQACRRCRAQKIKCQPRGSACVLCIKQGFECKFAARAYQNTASRRKDGVSTAQNYDVSMLQDASPRDFSPSDQRSYESIGCAYKSSVAAQSVEVPRPNKDLELALAEETSSCPPQTLQASDKGVTSPLAVSVQKVLASDDLSVDIDPYLFNASLTKHYVKQYFDSINRSPFYLLSKSPFLRWLASPEKTTTEKILLYTVMAAGAIFSRHKDQNTHHVMFTRVARNGLSGCISFFEMPVVHTLLILSTVSGHAGDLELASNDSILAIRCAYGLQLNQETAYPASNLNSPYLTKNHVAECCRRTFWLAYIKSSIWGFLLGRRSSNLALQGTLKMPCSDTAYEAGEASAALLLSLSSSDDRCEALIRGADQSPSHIALLAEATAILSDIEQRSSLAASTEHTHRSRHSTGSRLPVDEVIRLWCRRREQTSLFSSGDLPLELQVMDKYMSMTAHRHLQEDALNQTNVQEHYLKARHAAMQLLEQLHGPQSDESQEKDSGMSADAFMSCAIFRAFDIVTAAGVLSDIIDRREKDESGRLTFMSLATRAITSISNAAEYSKLAEIQLRAMKDRLAAIMTQTNTTKAWRKLGFRFSDPLCRSLRRGHDLVYDVKTGGVANALGLGNNGDDMLEIRVSSDDL